MQAKEIIDQLSPNTLRIGLEITLALLSSLAIFCATFAFHKGRQFFAAMDSKLDVIKDNHLTHIQAATSRTAELMEKMVEGQRQEHPSGRNKRVYESEDGIMKQLNVITRDAWEDRLNPRFCCEFHRLVSSL